MRQLTELLGQSDCNYDEKPPEEWSAGRVGFKPAPVFDVFRTEGESLPDLDSEMTGDAGSIDSTYRLRIDVKPALLEPTGS